MARQRTKQGGADFDQDEIFIVQEPRHTIESGQDPITVDTTAIMASVASSGSIASVAGNASSGSIASVAGIASRSTFASEASAGSISGAASYGSLASIASHQSFVSFAEFASQGSAGFASKGSRASAGSTVSLGGPVFLTLPAIAQGNNMHIAKKGASGSYSLRTSDSTTINGGIRRDNATEHQIDFHLPNGVDWTVQS